MIHSVPRLPSVPLLYSYNGGLGMGVICAMMDRSLLPLNVRFVKYSLNQTQSYLKQRKATETDYLQLVSTAVQEVNMCGITDYIWGYWPVPCEPL